MMEAPQDEPQDINDHAQLTANHLEQMSEDDTEYSSETTDTDDNSKYVPSNDSTVKSGPSDIPLDQHELTEITCEDFFLQCCKYL